jgi:molybdopterin converting factor small subunit
MARGLRVHVDVPERVEVEGATAREAIEALVALYPALHRFVLDDATRLRQHVNIYINDELIVDRDELSDEVRSGDRVYILPAVSGGATHSAASKQASIEASIQATHWGTS